MNSPEQDPLLNELLSGEELSVLRRTSLEHGLATLRRQRNRRKIARHALTLCLWSLLIAGLFSYDANRHSSSDPNVPARPPAADVTSGNESQVKFIDDDELFRLFPGRAMALIGKPGAQELVFLDRSSSGFHD